MDIILLITRIKEEIVKNKVECEKIFLKAFIPLLAERLLLNEDWFGFCLMANQPLYGYLMPDKSFELWFVLSVALCYMWISDSLSTS